MHKEECDPAVLLLEDLYNLVGICSSINSKSMHIWKTSIYLCLSILAVNLLSACNPLSPERPAQTSEKALASAVTPTPLIVSSILSHTPTMTAPSTNTPIPAPTQTATPKPSPTLLATFAATPSSTSTSTIKDSIILLISFIGRHGVGDKFYFHVLLNSEEADFVPISIYVNDQGLISGPFSLDEKSELLLCPDIGTFSQSIFETDDIDKAYLPTDFWGRLMEATFVYYIDIKEGDGAEKVIEITRFPGICESITE